MSGLARLAFHPVPEVGRRDTSLRYTDILFGFVIRELFLRLQNWPQLDRVVKWHLMTATILVLGSWIGYRRSLNRSSYEVKFFNVPFWRFVVDQFMLVVYFRMAVLTTTAQTSGLDWQQLVLDTTRLTAYVFASYVVWDLLGLWMSVATDSQGAVVRPRYPMVDADDNPTTSAVALDWIGFGITTAAFIAVAALWLLAGLPNPWAVLPALIIVLLAYRWSKEMRTSWLLQRFRQS